MFNLYVYVVQDILSSNECIIPIIKEHVFVQPYSVLTQSIACRCSVVIDMEEGEGDDEEFGFSRNYFLAKELVGSGKKSSRKLADINAVDEQVRNSRP